MSKQDFEHRAVFEPNDGHGATQTPTEDSQAVEEQFRVYREELLSHGGGTAKIQSREVGKWRDVDKGWVPPTRPS